MSMPKKPGDASPSFTGAEWQMLQRLHRRYRQDHDLLTELEMARLRFVRWLIAAGRLDGDGALIKEGDTTWRT
jgi:hypothetical protein